MTKGFIKEKWIPNSFVPASDFQTLERERDELQARVVELEERLRVGSEALYLTKAHGMICSALGIEDKNKPDWECLAEEVKKMKLNLDRCESLLKTVVEQRDSSFPLIRGLTEHNQRLVEDQAHLWNSLCVALGLKESSFHFPQWESMLETIKEKLK